MLNGRTYINRKVNKLESNGNTGFLEVRVFSTTTSFNVVLTPVMEGESYVRFIIIPEKHW